MFLHNFSFFYQNIIFIFCFFTTVFLSIYWLSFSNLLSLFLFVIDVLLWSSTFMKVIVFCFFYLDVLRILFLLMKLSFWLNFWGFHYISWLYILLDFLRKILLKKRLDLFYFQVIFLIFNCNLLLGLFNKFFPLSF